MFATCIITTSLSRSCLHTDIIVLNLNDPVRLVRCAWVPRTRLTYLKVAIFLRVLTFDISVDLHKSAKFNTCKN